MFALGLLHVECDCFYLALSSRPESSRSTQNQITQCTSKLSQ